MKYKVTRRGWIVIVVLLILVLVSSISLISKLGSPMDNIQNENSNTESKTTTNDDDDENSKKTLEDESSEVNSEESTDESNVVTEVNYEDNLDESNEVISEEGTDESSEVNLEDESKYDFESFILTIYYDKNEFSLNKDYYESLNDVIQMMSFNKSVKLAIEGHINGFPDYSDGEYGLSISLNRANVVKEYLIEEGVSEDRISIINKGSSDQISISEDLSKHYLNRRAYLYFINN